MLILICLLAPVAIVGIVFGAFILGVFAATNAESSKPETEGEK